MPAPKSPQPALRTKDSGSQLCAPYQKNSSAAGVRQTWNAVSRRRPIASIQLRKPGDEIGDEGQRDARRDDRAQQRRKDFAIDARLREDRHCDAPKRQNRRERPRLAPEVGVFQRIHDAHFILLFIAKCSYTYESR